MINGIRLYKIIFYRKKSSGIAKCGNVNTCLFCDFMLKPVAINGGPKLPLTFLLAEKDIVGHARPPVVDPVKIHQTRPTPGFGAVPDGRNAGIKRPPPCR